MDVINYGKLIYGIILNKNNKVISLLCYAISIILVAYFYIRNFIFKPIDFIILVGFLSFVNILIQYTGYRYNNLFDLYNSNNDFIDELSILLCLIDENKNVIYMNKNMRLLINNNEVRKAEDLPNIFKSYNKLYESLCNIINDKPYTSEFRLGDTNCKLITKKLPNNQKFICLMNVYDNLDKDKVISELVNKLNFGVILADEGGQVIFSNTQANNILSKQYLGCNVSAIEELNESVLMRKKQYFTISSCYLLDQKYKFFKIEKQQNLVNAILDDCPMGIIVIDKDQKILEVNQFIKRKTSCDLEMVWDIIERSQRSAFREYVNEFINHNKNLEQSLFSTNYNTIVSVNIRYCNDRYMVYLVEDQMGDPFLHKQRIYMIGESASAIIHDCNNIIMNIISIVNLLILEDEKNNNLIVLKNNSNSLAVLIKQILGLTDSSLENSLEALNVNEQTKKFLDNLGKLIYSNIIFKPSEHNPYILFNDINLEQILMNLLNNANYAIQKANRSPQITITIDKNKIHKFTVDNNFQISSGEYAQITIEDNGCGISAENIKNIFTPYFTTKAKEGSGLGLFSVATIIKRYKGFVKVRSNMGSGSKFVVNIPLYNSQAHDDYDQNKVILFVEDNDNIKQIVDKNLSSKYTVMFASDYDEAINQIKNLSHLDLLVTDIQLPHSISGIDVYNQVKFKFTHTKVLFISGYEKGAINIPQAHFLQKPFFMTELKDRIKNIFDE